MGQRTEVRFWMLYIVLQLSELVIALSLHVCVVRMGDAWWSSLPRGQLLTRCHSEGTYSMEIQRSEALHRPHPLSIHTCFRYQQPPNEKLVDLILTGSISRRSLVIAYYHVAVGWPLSTGQQLRGVFVSVSHREACLYCLEPTRRTEYLRIHSGAAIVMSMAESLEFEVLSGSLLLLFSVLFVALCVLVFLVLLFS